MKIMKRISGSAPRAISLLLQKTANLELTRHFTGLIMKNGMNTLLHLI